MIFQFPESYFATRADIVAFQDRLTACMPRTCEVEDFDTGSGTTSFFVLTKTPLAAHKTFRKYLGTRALERKLRVAYQSLRGDVFTNLWPFRDPRPFRIVYPPGEDPFVPASKRKIPKRSSPGVSKLKTRAAR